MKHAGFYFDMQFVRDYTSMKMLKFCELSFFTEYWEHRDNVIGQTSADKDSESPDSSMSSSSGRTDRLRTTFFTEIDTGHDFPENPVLVTKFWWQEEILHHSKADNGIFGDKNAVLNKRVLYRSNVVVTVPIMFLSHHIQRLKIDSIQHTGTFRIKNLDSRYCFKLKLSMPDKLHLRAYWWRKMVTTLVTKCKSNRCVIMQACNLYHAPKSFRVKFGIWKVSVSNFIRKSNYENRFWTRSVSFQFVTNRNRP